MNAFVHNLPPQFKECVKELQEHILEIEVSHINFITSDGKLTPQKEQINAEKSEKSNDTPKRITNSVSNSSSFEKDQKTFNKNCVNHNKSNCVQVKIVWFGESRDEANNVSISCESQQYRTANINEQSPPQQQPPNCKLKTKRKSAYATKQKYKHRPHFVAVSANNKLRYHICTSGSLFLDYLRSRKPIQIIVSTANGCSSPNRQLGQTQLRLPSVLLRKFSSNFAKGHNFEHKTKIYTLYKQQHLTTTSASSPDLVCNTAEKSGEIQLCFKMLFAPSAVASPTAMATKHKINVLHEKQLTSSHHHHHHRNCHHHPHMVVNSKSSKVAEHVIQGDKSNRLSSQTKTEEIVEAMKKLDAKLVAYLAGETEITSKLPNCVQENEVNLSLKHNHNNNNGNNIATHFDDLSPATKLNIFKTIKGIKLEMEALTLQPDGTKCMDLMQNEIRPIITVECQLSNELIKKVPRYDMYHIMQFESEKFQSLTQCTRFGQEAERNVKLDLDENGNIDDMNLGRLYFTVWWREPGTCLNEMLGMGMLELSDLYNASLLEQCKRIVIERRGLHLACLYFKITLQSEMKSSLGHSKRELFLPKQSSCDSGDEKSPQNTDKQSTSSSDAAQQQQQNQQVAQCKPAADKSSTEKATSAQNNNTNILQTANFDEETTKIRLLKGFIYANEARNLEIKLQPQKFLICRRFWLDEKPVAATADDANKFNYQEQFSIINDEKFLQRVDKQSLHLELWHRMSSDDGNGNPTKEHKVKPVGLVRIPLHQFFIAYRDAAITNHLCKGKLPVISIDSWAPIINWETGNKIGELKCLLAVGSEEQIKNLKETRGFNILSNLKCNDKLLENNILSKLQPLQIATTSNNSNTTAQSSTSAANNNAVAAAKMKKTSDLLDMLQKVLMTPPAASPTLASTTAKSAFPATAATTTPASSPSTSALKPFKPSNVKLIKFALEVQKAIGLPLNPAAKAKKGAKQRNASKRFPPNEPPNTYVTFQADEGQYPLYKSHEGMVFATQIIEKTTQPQWQQRFRLAATIDYLNNPQKRFILKVWKKSALDIAQGRNQPTPMEDAIIGFAALDLSVFKRGLHIGGRFNIVDFNGRMNGQLEIRCQPLEEIAATTSTASTGNAAITEGSASTTVDAVIDQFEQTLDLTHLNLGQAIKRKFTELEGISQRLRARLGDVTGSEIPSNFDVEQFDAWQPLEIEIKDNDVDEFEHDLNTPIIEEAEEKPEQKAEIKKSQEVCEQSPKSQGKQENENTSSSE